MNTGRIVIIAGVTGIIIIILALILTSYQESEETDYKPGPKEWITSGPFQIDRSEYAIGEKIFMIVDGIKLDEKGQIDIMRPINATHLKLWDSIPFDGAQKPKFNFYIEPKVSKIDELCSVDDITGKWSLIFRGTNYTTLDFDITKKIVPGTNIEPVC